MPELAGDDREEFVAVLKEGARFSGYVAYEKDARRDLETFLSGWSQQGITRELLAYAEQGGKISRSSENREEWRDKWKHCYHLWPISTPNLFISRRGLTIEIPMTQLFVLSAFISRKT